jgi:hypothetical protein
MAHRNVSLKFSARRIARGELLANCERSSKVLERSLPLILRSQSVADPVQRHR